MRKSKFLRNANGSITIYALVSMLFFMAVSVGIYTTSSNKIQQQDKQIEQIQESYEKETDENEIYENKYEEVKDTITPTIKVYAQDELIATIEGNKVNQLKTIYTHYKNVTLKFSSTLSGYEYGYSTIQGGTKTEGQTVDVTVTEGGVTIYSYLKDTSTGLYFDKYTAVTIKLTQLNAKEMYIAEGQKKNIEVTGNANIGDITYSDISDSTIVNLTDNETLTGLKAGIATIKATESKGGATTIVTVKVTKIELEKTEGTMLTDDVKTILISGVNYGTLTVKTSDTNVAEVSIQGTALKIKATKAGNSTITVTESNGGATAEYLLKVSNVTLSPNGGNYLLPTESTKATVKTAINTENADKIEYAWETSAGQENWVETTSGTTITKNDCTDKETYYIYVRINEEVIYKSSAFNITTNKITIIQDKEEWTNENVICTITYPQESVSATRKAAYGTTLSDATTNSNSAAAPTTTITVGSNGYVYAQAVDIAGNKIIEKLEIKNIDKTAPSKPVVEKSYYSDGSGEYTSGIWTNKIVITKITSNDMQSGVKEIQYSLDKTKWTKLEFGSDGLVKDGDKYYGLEEWTLKNRNDVLYFKAIDNVGNESEISESFNIKYDITVPTLEITVSIGAEPTKENSITYTFKFSEDVTDFTIDDINVTNGTKGEFKGSASTYTLVVTNGTTGDQKVEVPSNKCIDKAGNGNTGASKTIKIDRTEPKVTFGTNGNTAYKKSQSTTVTVEDVGTSGVNSATLKYQWSQSTTEPEETSFSTTFKNGDTITKSDGDGNDWYLWILAKDNLGNTTIAKSNAFYLDNTAPTFTNYEIKNLSTTGYDVYVYGVLDSGSGINRVQFPTWTKLNGQDDIQSSWVTNSSATGTKQSDGTTWKYRVNVTDHKNEAGTYNTQIYIYDNLENVNSITDLTTTVPTVKIIFDENYNSVTTTVEKAYNTELGTLSSPTRTGNSFAGWFTASTGGTQISSTTKTPANDTTYYAHWTANTYTVEYNGNGNTGGSTASSIHTYDVAKKLTANGYTREYTVTYNHNYSGSTDTNKTATYTFNGWATSTSGDKVYDNEQSVKNLTATKGATVTLYAKWNSASVNYTPTRTGYTFGGWYKEAACTNKISDATYTPTGNMTLYAKWTANTYTVEYNGNGNTGGSTASSIHTYDVEKNLTANGFTKTGYTFKGWATSDSATSAAYVNSASVKNLIATNGATVTLYAVWKDETKPTITGVTATTNSIKITATDEGSGIVGYAVTTTNTAPSSFTSCTNTKSLSTTVTGKKQGTTYYVWVKDAAGNVSTSKSATTGTVTGLTSSNASFSYNPTTWTNGNVTATASTTVTGFTLQTSKDGTTWNSTSTQTFTKNGTVYARLWDGTNYGGTFSGNVTNIDKDAPSTPTITAITADGNSYTSGNWTNQNVTITASSNDSASKVKEIQYSYDKSTWKTDWGTDMTTSGNTSTISGTWAANNEWNITIYVRAIDNVGNTSGTASIVLKQDITGPTMTSAEVKNVTSTGYDVYVYGVQDSGSGVNRVQFPTWTEFDGQDDIQSSWATNSSATGTKQSDGTTWKFHVNVADHGDELGTYNTHIYAYDNLGNEGIGNFDGCVVSVKDSSIKIRVITDRYTEVTGTNQGYLNGITDCFSNVNFYTDWTSYNQVVGDYDVYICACGYWTWTTKDINACNFLYGANIGNVISWGNDCGNPNNNLKFTEVVHASTTFSANRNISNDYTKKMKSKYYFGDDSGNFIKFNSDVEKLYTTTYNGTTYDVIGCLKHIYQSGNRWIHCQVYGLPAREWQYLIKYAVAR